MQFVRGRHNQGFILPTVILASIMLLIVLAAGVQLVATTSAALRDQYYLQLAREASESGSVHMQNCLKKSAYAATWTAAKPLRPNTDCNGDIIPGVSEYMLQHGNIKMSYSVGVPYSIATGHQSVAIVGDVFMAHPDTGVTLRKLASYNNASGLGGQVGISSVIFGYMPDAGVCSMGAGGAFYSTIDYLGVVRSAGVNSCGQLGMGDFNNVSNPRPMINPSGKKIVRTFTNPVSRAFTLFTLTDNGEVWGAGVNRHGGLGSGNIGNFKSVPEKFQLPAGDDVAKYVVDFGFTTFVVTTKNNVYAAGENLHGKAGVDTSGQFEYRTPSRVALPAGERVRTDGDAWGVDIYNAFTITESGKVYGWGAGFYGQLGLGDQNDRYVPTRIGQFGDSGHPKAVQVVTDGETVYIRDSNGDIWSSGKNSFGQVGTRTFRIMRGDKVSNTSTPVCLTAVGGGVRWQNCSASKTQEWTFTTDQRLQVTENPAAATMLCLDASGPSMNACNSGVASQKWLHLMLNKDPALAPGSWNENDWSIEAVHFRSQATAQCISGAASGDGSLMESCPSSNLPSRTILTTFTTELSKINFPDGRKAVDVSTDQFFATAVMTDGSVYNWGLNNNFFGTGATCTNTADIDGNWQHFYNPEPVKWDLPAGVRATKSWTIAQGWVPLHGINVYVMTDDGRVFGVGDNHYGQLGLGYYGGGCNGRRLNSPQQMLVIGQGSDFAREVRSGSGSTVIYTSNNRAYTVGNNQNGQLGDGTTNNSNVPRANIYTNPAKNFIY